MNYQACPNSPRGRARALAKFTPVHHWEGVNSNWAENATFWGNALYTVFAWHSSKTSNWTLKGNAIRNDSPVSYFWVQQNLWAIQGVWIGRRAHKLPIWKNSISVPGQIGNVFMTNLQHVCWQSGQIRVSYYLDINNFLYAGKKKI